MFQKGTGIYNHNIRIFYFVDAVRAMWFLTSVWVIFERQYLTLSQLTFVEAFIIGITLVMQLPTGAFADMFGKKTAMVIGGLLYSAALLFYSFSNSFGMFLIYGVIFGMAEAFIDGTREALLYDTLKQDHLETQFPKVSSKLSMIFQVSLSAATLVGGWLGTYSYEYAIRATSAVFFLSAIGCFFFVEPTIKTEKFTMKNYLNKTKLGIKELFKNPYIKKISIYYIMIGSLTWVSVITFGMVLLTELKYTPLQIGIAVATSRIVNSVVLFRLLHAGKFFTRKRTFILLPVILILSYTPVLFMSKWLAIIPVMAAMFVSGARWNILSHYTNAEFDSKNRATAISALCMVIGLVYVGVVGISGYVMDTFGGARIIYTVLGCVTLFTALPLGVHLSRRHSDE
jgi:MFS family permease